MLNDNGPFHKKISPGNVVVDTRIGRGTALSTRNRGDDLNPVSGAGPLKKKPTVLVVDDEAGPRNALRFILSPFFTIRAAEDARTAIQVLHEQPIDLITLDQNLPGGNGIDLLQEILHDRPDVEVIMITGNGTLASAIESTRYGAAGYLLKPFNIPELLTLMNLSWEKKQRLDFLRTCVRNSQGLWGTNQESTQAWQDMQTRYFLIGELPQNAPAVSSDPIHLLPLLCDLLEATDRQLLSHCSRVNFYATLLATQLHLTHAEQKSLTLGAFLHDIGKIRIDKDALSRNQTANLGESESDNGHAELGAQIVLQLGLPAEVAQIIACHHRWYDGSGSPRSLQGHGNPLLGRIVCIAQAFDCLTAGGTRRMPMAVDAALRSISGEAGTHFDPMLTRIFTRAITVHKETLPALALAPMPSDL
ncbi:MAG: HD domain-containing phosphohydrolase [Nitrospirota bacterium]